MALYRGEFLIAGTSGAGTNVTVNPIITSGTKIAEITVDGDKKDIYSPTGSSGSTMATPVGTIIAWTGLSSDEKIPEGYLICNGQEVSKTEYSDLYNVVGDKFGTASSSDKFKLPLLTDERYLLGNLSAGMDISAGLPNITGNLSAINLGDGTHLEQFGETIANQIFHDGVYGGQIYSGEGASIADLTITQGYFKGWSFDASKSNSIYGNSSTVTPKSMTVIYLICYKVIGTYIGRGYGGGVIDGTILTSYTMSDSVILTSDIKTEVYLVENDCWCVIQCPTTAFKLNGRYISAYANNGLIGVWGDYSDEDTSRMIISAPIKKGTKISVQSNFIYNFKTTFIEYKLNSLAPQIAMPDYDKDWTTINDGDTINESGWIKCVAKLLLASDTGSTLYINGKAIYWSEWLNATTAFDINPSFIPVSKGDKVTFGESKNLKVDFLPCKSVPQPDCASYVIETGKFSFSTGEKDSDPTKNDSWYRLYSDGWCELGGYYDGSESSISTIKLFKQYNYKNYTANAVVKLTTTGTPTGIGILLVDKKTNEFTITFNAGTALDSWKTEGFVS